MKDEKAMGAVPPSHVWMKVRESISAIFLTRAKAKRPKPMHSSLLLPKVFILLGYTASIA